VIGQLETVLRGVLTSVSVELSDLDGIKFAPFPIPPISAAVGQTILSGCQSRLGHARILISGEFVGEQIDEVVESHEIGVGEEMLKTLFADETVTNGEVNLRKDQTPRGVLSLNSQMRFARFRAVIWI
jgi:hypothetical protein